MKGKPPPSDCDSKAFTGWSRVRIAAALILASCLPLLAQNSGTLRGRVTDKEGVPLPGAIITVQSEKNPSASSLGTVTDAGGQFRLAGLPPGDDYAISASFPGMTTIIQQPVQIQSDKSSTVDFVLSEELVETIRVEAQGSIVDTTTATTTTTVNEEFIANLPILGRNFTDLLTLAPGVTDTDGDGRPNVHGAREVDFQTRLSGVNVTDPFTGLDTSEINIEAIEEVQLITTGASAEYGRFQGGMANVTTKSGGNEFQGSFKVFYQTRSLDSDGVHNQDSVDLIEIKGSERVIDPRDSEPDSFRTLKPFLTLGGALKRDRLWYFLANQYIDQQEPVNFLGVTINQTIEGWNEYGKLTWQINADHKATLEGLYDPRETTGNNIGLGISPRSDFSIKRTLPVVTARETWIISPTVMLESTVSYLKGSQEVRPVVALSDVEIACPSLILSDPDLWEDTCARLPADSYTQKLSSGQLEGPWWVDQDSDSERFTVKEDLSFYVDDLLGSHQFKFGFEWTDEDYDTTVTQRPLAYEFEGVRGNRSFLWADFEDRVQNAVAEGNTLGVYLQDSWRVLPNLTLNLGVRLDMERVEAPGQTIFDPAAERAEFNALAAQVYTNFNPDPLTWTESTGIFNLEPLPDGSLSCDIAPPGANSMPGVLCDEHDRIAMSRIFTRHESERTNSPYFTPLEGPFDLAPCGAPERWGTCRGEEKIDLENTNLAPRVSISYDPFADDKMKLFASWGRFYDRLFLGTVIPEQARDFDYISLARDETTETFSGPAQRNFQIYQVSRDLSTPFVDEFVLGLERELSPEFSVRANFIRRKGRDQIQTRDINHSTRDLEPADGVPDDEFFNDNPGGGGSPGTPDTFADLYPINPFFGGIFFLDNVNFSDFRAFEVNLVKRLHRNWQFDFSYTYSEAKGNAEAFEDFFLGNDTSQVENEAGFLDFDQRHVVKFSAVAHFPKQIRFGTRLTWESGLPFSLIRRGFTFDNQGNPTFRQIFPTGQRNDQRNSGRWLIDLNLGKDFNMGKVGAGVEFTVINLLNSDDLEIGNINDFSNSFQLVDGTARRFGRRFQLGFTMNF